MRRTSQLVSIVALTALLAAPVAPLESCANEVTVYVNDRGPEPNGVSMMADFLIARPLGLVATVVGATFYVVAFPFAALAGDIHTPAMMLVGEPAKFTFDRPLGALDL